MKLIKIAASEAVYVKPSKEFTIEKQNEFIESSLSGVEPFLLFGFESQKDNPVTGRFFEVVDMVEEDNFSMDIHSDIIVLYMQSHNQKIINRFTENMSTFLNAKFEVIQEN
jgi:hypothetical protein